MAKKPPTNITELHRPSVSRLFLKSLFVDVNPEPYSQMGTPTPDVALNLRLIPQESKKEVTAELSVVVDCTHKSQELFHIEFVYRAVILQGASTDEDMSAFLNIGFPPVITTEAKNLLSRLTTEIGICHISIDPWEFAEGYLKDILSSS